MDNKPPEIVTYDPAKLAAAEEEERRRIHRLHWLDSRVPPEFERPQPDYLRPFLEMSAVLQVREIIRDWRDQRQEPEKLMRKPLLIGICGSVGTGKTTVAVELLRMASHNYASVRYFTLHRYLRVIDTHSMEADDIETEFLQPKMVVIDDIHVPQFENLKPAFSQLVVDRCAALRWTILVSTVDPSEFANVLGPQVVDRLTAPAMPLVGKSHRSYA